MQVTPGGASPVCYLTAATWLRACSACSLAGRAYVPLDATHPVDRSAFVVRDSGARTLLCDGENAPLAASIGADVRVLDISNAVVGGAPRLRPRASDLAYCLYTSGSTGRPKGVLQTHAHVVHLLDGYAKRLELASTDVVTLLSTFAFDAAVVDVFSTLLAGATLCTYELRARGLGGLAGMLSERGVTVYHSTPTVWRELVSLAPSLPESIRAVVLGGEEVVADDIARLRSACRPDAVLVNGYGMTECSWALLHVVRPGEQLERRTVALGSPIDRVRVTLETPLGPQRVPYGIGTIKIASPDVALGYHDRPEESSAAFPVAGTYVTTDLGRLLPSGELEFAGRHAHQVKLRGFRIDLREIEAVLESYPGISKAAAAVHEGVRGPELVGYAVGSDAGSATLREFLGTRLPEYMVPAVIVSLTSLPTGATGKLDRRALPAPDASAFPTGDNHVAPRTPIEQVVAEIWSGLLGVEQIGVHDDFFDLGGHSLLAMRILAQLQRRFGVELSVRVFFESPTVEGLAVEIARSTATPPKETVSTRPRTERPPLSFAQERLWFLQQLDPTSSAYVLSLVLEHQELDVDALRRALDALVARHEILRTSFPSVDGSPYQRIHPPAPVDLVIEDASALPRVRIECLRPFELAAAPPLRVHLVRSGARSYVMFLTMHHIIVDGTSFAIMQDELWTLYDGLLASTTRASALARTGAVRRLRDVATRLAGRSGARAPARVLDRHVARRSGGDRTSAQGCAPIASDVRRAHPSDGPRRTAYGRCSSAGAASRHDAIHHHLRRIPRAALALQRTARHRDRNGDRQSHRGTAARTRGRHVRKHARASGDGRSRRHVRSAARA